MHHEFRQRPDMPNALRDAFKTVLGKGIYAVLSSVVSLRNFRRSKSPVPNQKTHPAVALKNSYRPAKIQHFTTRITAERCRLLRLKYGYSSGMQIRQVPQRILPSSVLNSLNRYPSFWLSMKGFIPKKSSALW